MFPQTPPAQIAPQAVYLKIPAPSLGLLELPGEQGGLLIGNPEPVLTGNLRFLLCSPDSRTLVLLREVRPSRLESLPLAPSDAAPGVLEVLTYETRRKRLRMLWSQEIAAGVGVDARLIGWLGKTGIALAALHDKTVDVEGKFQRRETIAMIDPVRGTVKTTLGPPEYGWFGLHVSPELPFAALGGPDGSSLASGVEFLRADGTRFTVPMNGGEVWGIRSSDDGKAFLVDDLKQAYAVRPDTGTVTKIPPLAKKADGGIDFGDESGPEKKLPFELATLGKSVVLKGKQVKSQVTLCADGQPVTLLPNGSGALFQQQGTLFFVPFVALPKAAFDPLNAKAQRDEAIQIAHEVGQALVGWAFQHDKNAPVYPSESDWKAAIAPLLRDATVLTRFVYTPPASLKLEFTKESLKQPVGYVLAPGGRAVCLPTSGAKWQPDEPR
ncbi:hypothetical protein [Armatimonas sp.]|uniref:hypothetical protein n=1 Tax=Armatimonas sp. TaxID=1872638 RepID=UPI00375250A6